MQERYIQYYKSRVNYLQRVRDRHFEFCDAACVAVSEDAYQHQQPEILANRQTMEATKGRIQTNGRSSFRKEACQDVG